jgi:hypothetical protein
VFRRCWCEAGLGGGVEGHGVPEAFELGDEPLEQQFGAAWIQGQVAISSRQSRSSRA